jgi:regulator of sigma E protease
MLDMLAYLAVAVPSFLVVLTIVVTVHELGHFLSARACGVAVDRFSIGFGRPIAAWKDRGGVEWRIGWIPFGGYVRFAGDENEASIPDQEHLEALRQEVVQREGGAALSRYYHFKPLWQRALIAAAGPAANFVLAVTLFSALLFFFGEQTLPARVASVQPNSPAAAAGLKPGDVILAADGRDLRNFEELSTTVQLRAGVPIVFDVDRGGQPVKVSVTPAWKVVKDQFGDPQRVGQIGVIPEQEPHDYVMVRYGPAEAVAGGVRRSWEVLSTTVYYLGRIFSGQVSADQISGPLGIANVTGKVAKLSAEGAPNFLAMVGAVGVNLLNLTAMVSVSIGFINLLPIPILDGGHLLFYAYEAVARRPLTAKVQAAGYRVGLALVLGLMLFATWNDLQRLRVFKFLGQLLS